MPDLKFGIRERILSVIILPLLLLLACVALLAILSNRTKSQQNDAVHSTQNLDILASARETILDAYNSEQEFVFTGKRHSVLS